MRFAVSLLVFICVASAVGTLLPQNRAASAYIDQFGPFWFEVFDKFSLWHIYNSGWFLLIMAFLVISTSVCLTRNTPKMLRDARSFREYLRASSLRAFPHKVEIMTAESVAVTAAAGTAMLRGLGYAVRQRRDGENILLAAKKGSANRLGYFCAHTAMVIICVGGLLDSELPLRLQILLNGKKPIVENMLISQVPESGRLSLSNPGFRGNMLIPEGGQANTAVVMVNDGALVQPLPFTLKLKKFIIDYYSTGMPSRFASMVEVTDLETGNNFNSTIEVNKPLRYKGVTVYQSSFDDGGSKVTLIGYPLVGTNNTPLEATGTVGKTIQLQAQTGRGLRELVVEITALRPINVEDLAHDGPTPTLSQGQQVASVTGSAAVNKGVRNVGPSVEYKLVDQAGQAHEFQNYMLPVILDGAGVFLAGVRNSSAENYHYLRIPADEESSLGEFMRLRALLADPAAREQAAHRLTQRNPSPGTDRPALEMAAQRALETFASGGLRAVADFLQSNTPPAQLEHAAEIVVRLINLSMAELRAIERERAGLPPLPNEGPAAEDAANWLRLAVTALSDLTLYPAPLFLALGNFEQVQASVFQISRTPGKAIVYLGCVLLIFGVFSMFYLRDRRAWLWIQPRQDGAGSSLLAAMTSQKRTLDFNHEFDRFKQALERL